MIKLNVNLERSNRNFPCVTLIKITKKEVFMVVRVRNMKTTRLVPL